MASPLLKELFPDWDFKAVNYELLEKAQKHLDNLSKPKGSLGRLEELAVRLYAIAGGKIPLGVDPCIMFTVAADHGVAAQGVSPYPQVVTRQMVENFLAGGAAINILCANGNLDLKIVDAGCAGGPFAPNPMLIDKRLGPGTDDMSKGPAMSRETCVAALRTGFELGMAAARKGYACLCIGEMGIANTTPATALFCAFLGFSPREVAGPGTGASAAMIRHKADIVAKALKANSSAMNSQDPVAILAALGGFEITQMAGLMLACAASSIPFLVDGFISASAYVAACAIFPALSGYAFFSHNSAEPAWKSIMKRLGRHPLLDLGLRLGEGTGAALALPLLRGAANIYNNMSSLADACVSATDADKIYME